ncbi:MAG: M15 family metallopeptidase [Culicoidibacterales bacterium]
MKPIQKPRVKSMHLNDKKRRRIKKTPVIVLVIVLILVIGGVLISNGSEKGSGVEIPLTPTPVEPVTEGATSSYDIDTPESLTAIINKQRPLAAEYVPNDLVVPTIAMRGNISDDEQYVRQATATALETMAQAAANEGIELVLGSGYRSYDLQENLFSSYAEASGIEQANTYSARAGQSEHQTGLAVDLVGSDYECYLEICFEETSTGQWLKEHAHKYGFIIRFLQGKESITGYQYEPWHLRYVGTELATAITQSGLTMEEYFKLVE